jgi:hypothetical protein
MYGRRPVLLLVVVGCAVAMPAAEGREQPRFLIFHLDAVSAATYDALLTQGRLPHLASVFADGTRLDALTLFPASTPMIYTRLHTGGSNADPGPVGFGGFDRGADRPIGEA